MLRQRFTGLWRHAAFIRVWIEPNRLSLRLFDRWSGSSLHRNPDPSYAVPTRGTCGRAPRTRRLTGLFAGAWADRLRRRPIMIGADIGRAMLLATIPVAAVPGLLRVQQL